MAEALGTVASVIAVVDLAGKAVTVSFKLKSLWEEVKDLPETLLEKAEELQDLDDFLRDAESNAANNPLPNSVWNGTIMQNAIGRARAAMDDFQRALDTHIDSLADKRRRKQKLAAAKILFQKGSLEAMERKLDRALRLFRMAQNQYCVMCASTIVERLPKPLDKSDTNNAASVIVERLPQSADEFDTESAEADDFVGSEHYFHEFLRLRKSHLAKPFSPDAAAMSKGTTMLGRLGFGFSFQSSHISFRSPSWLGNSVYSLMAQKSLSGWQLNLSSYEVMDSFPWSIQYAVWSDDIISLQKSLRQMSLTPYVHNRHGNSLLFVAACCVAVEVSRWLLSIGLYPGSFGEFSPTYLGKGRSQLHPRTPLERLLMIPQIQYAEQYINRRVDILRAFTACASDSVEDKGKIWQLVTQNSTFDQYRELQQVMNPEFLLAPFQARLWHCVEGIVDVHWTSEEIMCLLPEVRSFSAESIISFWSMSGEWLSLSHLMALGASWELPELDGELLQPLAKGTYCSVIGDIARSSPDELSRFLGGKRKTPLMALIEMTSCHRKTHSPQIFDRVLQTAIISWASILHVNGLNLLDYGCRERFSEMEDREGRIPGWSEGKVRWCNYFRILGITYGALPEQWKVWWSIYDYEYAGDFWRMIEDSAFSIPGSWEDDFDSDEEDDWQKVPWDDDDRRIRLVWSEYRKIRPPC